MGEVGWKEVGGCWPVTSPHTKVPGRQLSGSPTGRGSHWEPSAYVCAASATCSSSCQSMDSNSLKYQKGCTETGSNCT